MHFLHTADWQIGRHYGQFDPQDAAFLEEARLDVIETIATHARERAVDAVLVAGDVFDTQAVSDRTVRRLFAALEGFAGPWILIAGNHDAALADSVWTRARRLGCVPERLHIPEQTGVILLPDCSAAILAAPLRQRHTYDDVTEAFDRLDTPEGWLRIGLAHGSIAGRLPDTVDISNPIAPDRAARARLDYLALGDWHGCLQIGPRTWYAGTPETDRFRGNEPGAMLDVRIAAAGDTPDVQRVDVGRYRWARHERRIQVPSDVETLAADLAACGARDVIELVVAGEASMATSERLNEAVEQTRARVRSLRVDMRELALLPDDDDLAMLGAAGYVVDVAQTLQAIQAAGDNEVAGSGLGSGFGAGAVTMTGTSTSAEPPAASSARVAREALRLLLQFEREAALGQPGSTLVPTSTSAPEATSTSESGAA